MKRFNDLRIVTKLLSGYLVVALIGTMTALTGYLYISKFEKRTKDLYDNRVEPIHDLGEAYSNLIAVRGDIRLMLLETTPENQQKWLQEPGNRRIRPAR
ncbi:MAG: MCP four helix bundle domain-containing protein [Ignavibacteriales bacterium]